MPEIYLGKYDETDEMRRLPDWVLQARMFNEVRMFSKMQAFAQLEGLDETYQALQYMAEKHSGQYRKAGLYTSERVPYVIHPLMMACHAHAIGIREDSMLAAILLHDVCEDCGVEVEELPFGPRVRELVDLMTYRPERGVPEEETKRRYFLRLEKDGGGAIIKALDRCNNVSTMADCFSREKMVAYIRETEQYVVPMLRYVKENFREYNDVCFILKYHILSVIESLKNMLVREEMGNSNSNKDIS